MLRPRFRDRRTRGLRQIRAGSRPRRAARNSARRRPRAACVCGRSPRLARRPRRAGARGANAERCARKCGAFWKIPQADNPHPAPSPAELAARRIPSTDAGTVLDPFMGPDAAAGLDWLGTDVSKEYCRTARLRDLVRGAGGPARPERCRCTYGQTGLPGAGKQSTPATRRTRRSSARIRARAVPHGKRRFRRP